MMMQYEEVECLRKERKRKWSGDGTKQPKLIGKHNNQVSLNNKPDPLLQAWWYDALVQFVRDSGISFKTCEKLDIVLRAIWPNGKYLEFTICSTSHENTQWDGTIGIASPIGTV